MGYLDEHYALRFGIEWAQCRGVRDTDVNDRTGAVAPWLAFNEHRYPFSLNQGRLIPLTEYSAYHPLVVDEEVERQILIRFDTGRLQRVRQMAGSGTTKLFYISPGFKFNARRDGEPNIPLRFEVSLFKARKETQNIHWIPFVEVRVIAHQMDSAMS